MIYELRVYHAVPGRLPDLLKRFDTITLKSGERHKIKQAGFWTRPGRRVQPGALLPAAMGLARRPRDEWNAFQADPEMAHQARRNEKNGPIVARVINSFLQPTSFSAVK